MSELGERRWAVISERGREATGLNHEEAVGLLRELGAQKVYGTCVVTDRAALHLQPVKQPAQPNASQPNTTAHPAGTRGKA